jgi:hypothetical protein
LKALGVGNPIALAIALAAFAALVALAVAAAPEPSRALLRAAVGLVATLGYWEALLHLSGYLPRVEPPVSLRLGLRLGSPVAYFKALSTFTSGASAYRLAELLATDSVVLPLAMALVVAYLVKRVIDSTERSARGGLKVLALATAISILALATLTDGDLGYLESLAKLAEEVVRHAL